MCSSDLKYVVGWPNVIKFLAIGAFTGGHILIEGVPGTAKTDRKSVV